MPHVDALIAAEHVKDVPSPLIEELTNRLPRKQRQYLRILLNSLTEYETVSEARKKTTRRLKITSVYERQLWCRTRKLIQSVHTF
jgi:predicted KAP-like P-loop ATPase